MKIITKKVKKIIVNGATEKIEGYLKSHKVNLSNLSQKTGIPYRTLYASVGDKNRKRELRVNEFLSICKALGISIEQFYTFEPEEQEM